MSAKMRKLRKSGSSQSAEDGIVVSQREFSSVAIFQRYTEKVLAFQQEVDKVAPFRLEVDATTKLTDEMKRQVFIKLRDENYMASLRLEGFSVDSDDAPVTLEALRSKYVR
ncbi:MULTISPECIES: YhfG family protein [unclassified Duganella]|uniref:YhfG family protein n=1 Tax=unclassified Duganella TaxID=2636909 RepID=UPI0011C0CE2D|nr:MULTISPECIES: YhfG family protein [unclassified Duganella]